MSLSILSILYVLCRGFVGCWELDDFVVKGDFVVEGTLIGLVWFVGFYGISTFVGYLTPNPLICN